MSAGHKFCPVTRDTLVTLTQHKFRNLLYEMCFTPLVLTSLIHTPCPSCGVGNTLFFPGRKAESERDAHHSPTSSAEVKNEELYSSLLGVCMAVSGQLYLYFSLYFKR
jgi:hypothetical protein